VPYNKDYLLKTCIFGPIYFINLKIHSKLFEEYSIFIFLQPNKLLSPLTLFPFILRFFFNSKTTTKHYPKVAITAAFKNMIEIGFF